MEKETYGGVKMLQNSMNHLQQLTELYNNGKIVVSGICLFTIKEKTINSYVTTKNAIIIPVSGTGVFKFNDIQYTIKNGHMLHGSPNKNLNIRAINCEEFRYVAVYYQGQTDLNFACSLEKANGIITILETIIELQNKNIALDSYRIELLIEEFFCLLLLGVQEVFEYTEQYMLNSMREYIHYHYRDSITLAELATYVNEKEARVSYIFYKYLKIRPIDYLIDYRLSLAVKLLKTTNKTVETISTEVGYHDVGYFRRIFKKRLHLTPGQILRPLA